MKIHDVRTLLALSLGLLLAACVSLPDAPSWDGGDHLGEAWDVEVGDLPDAIPSDIPTDPGITGDLTDAVEPDAGEIVDALDVPGEDVMDGEAPDTADTADGCAPEACAPAAYPDLVPGPCERLAWDPVSCACALVDKGYREPCDDGDACTLEDSCDEVGQCAGEPLVCADGDPCTQDTCDAASGCVFAPVDGDCEDGNPCTIYDQCEGGVCVAGSQSPGCGACDPLDDVCELAFGNDDPCDGFLVCVGGTCAMDPSTVVSCQETDEGPCLERRCDPADGQCKVLPLADGAQCSDGNTCTADDACAEGACVGSFDSEAPGCACDADADCAPFEDGDLCNGVLKCQAGQCLVDLASEVPPCDPSLDTDCRRLRCEPASGACVLMAEPDGEACEDGNLCTLNDTCDAGVCVQGTLNDCAEWNTTCAQGQCLFADGSCVAMARNEGGACDNGDPCAEAAVCVQGQCETSAEIDCDDGDVCTLDSCDPVEGGCVYALVSMDTPEACNGLDDDCDGETDEGLSYGDPEAGEPRLLGESCVGLGVCGEGVVECDEGGAVTCSTNADGSASEAVEEVCNELDDDCDGQTDNGLSWLGVAVGGVCDGVGACGEGVVECREGGGVTCSTNPSGSAPEGVEEICNGLDDDCDGATDEELAASQSDCALIGVCQLGGVIASCEGEAGWGCDYAGVAGYQAGSEAGLCDGKDNDCDGATDEDFEALGEACDSEADEDLCALGTWACAEGGLERACVDDQPMAEVCDGVEDEDCDGAVDEEGAAGCVVYYQDGDGDGYGLNGSGRCLCAPDAGTAHVVEVDGDCEDSAETGSASQPGLPELCNGRDDDCDGQTDEGLDVWSEDCDCEFAGVCTQAAAVATCEAGQWSCDYAHVEGYEAGQELSCDGVDNDCDGETDEDFVWTRPEGGAALVKGAACGTGGCDGGVVVCTEAQDDLVCTTELGADVELCDAVDNDCDGETDEGLVYVDPVSQLPAALGEACQGHGACGAGVVVCGTGGLPTCSTNPDGDASQASDESCNDLDDDCDGQTDEALYWQGLALGAACDGLGACGEGVVECRADGGLACSTNPDGSDSGATDEVCNELDDDCDGLTDAEDPDLQALPPCEVQDGVCAGAAKARDLCVSGAWLACDDQVYATHAADYEAGVELSCDGLDNDCDGSVDEDFSRTLKDGTELSGVNQPCGAGICGGGLTACDVAGTGIVCPSEGKAQPEACNGKDDDCDGLTDALDDSLAGDDPRPCQRQDGVCAGAMKPASLCADGSWGACADARYLAHSALYEAGQEQRCDGQDNDCDGAADEDFSVTGADGTSYSGAGVECGVGACSGGTTACSADGAGLVCASFELAGDEVCDGVDNDCDGLKDAADAEDLLSHDLQDCELQEGACAGATKSASLCKQGAWSACAAATYAAHSEDYEADSETICDGLDNDCDGATDEEMPDTDQDGQSDCVDEDDDDDGVADDGDGSGVAGDMPCMPELVTSCDDNCRLDANADQADQDVDGLGDACDDDIDGDGSPNGADCAMTDPAVFPGASEVCNGVDDDCDGQTDAEDAADLLTHDGPTCALQAGVCAGAVAPASACAGGQWQPCAAVDYAAHSQAYEEGEELTCDGEDNDCDGAADEDFSYVDAGAGTTKAKGDACGTGACSGGEVVCTEDQAGLICSTDTGAGFESCDGVDNDCDGLTDADDPDLMTSDVQDCEAQAGVCAGATKPKTLCVGGAWQACTDSEYEAYSGLYQAGAEASCDGQDNDCDGAFDEDFEVTGADGTPYAGVGAACGVGACSGGATQCLPDKSGILCTTFADAGDEICNGLDDDCDGLIDADDAADLMSHDEEDCALQAGVCAGATQPALRCTGGAWTGCTDTDYAAWSAAYEASEEASCDGQDNDCDGAADEDFELSGADGTDSAGVDTPCGVGACGGGATECDLAGTGIVCSTAGLATDEVCDGADNDCDGATDADDAEEIVGGHLRHDEPDCEGQLGVCDGATKPASLCAAGAWGACTTATYQAHSGDYQPGGETSCDGLDNDCSGQIDEDFSVTGADDTTYAGVGVACGAGACAGGTTECTADKAGVRCPSFAEASDEVCDGVDNDCDGLIDAADAGDLLASDPQLCADQDGVCAGASKPAALCAGGAWGACDDLTYGAHSEHYQAALETSCDGRDNDCDELTDEDFQVQGPDGSWAMGIDAACGVGACASGITTCRDGGDGVTCSTAGEATTESCNSADDDCDGSTDEEPWSLCADGHTCRAGQCELAGLSEGFAFIPSGSFWMGSPSGEACPLGYLGGGCSGDGTGDTIAEPGRVLAEILHYVTLTRDFELAIVEASQGAWELSFDGWNPSVVTTCGDDCAVESVSWFDALVYANVRSKAAGLPACYVLDAVVCADGLAADPGLGALDCMNATRGGVSEATVSLPAGLSSLYDCAGYRLPTESEWEYAARAGTVSAYSNGQGSDADRLACETPFHWTDYAWYCANKVFPGLRPSGQKPASAWSLVDMSGNVWEWCHDQRTDAYPYPSGTLASPAIDPVGGTGSKREIRGGGFSSEVKQLRSAQRYQYLPDKRLHSQGFRLARTLPDLLTDADGDVIPGDGDASGIVGDAPCAGGQTTGCDDNCAWAANADQADMDGDGQGDACDPDDDGDLDPDPIDCQPLDASVSQYAAESCDGADNDCDGSTDEGFADADADGDADCVDWDDDGDGVADLGDNCPGLANADQADADGDGVGDACDLSCGGAWCPDLAGYQAACNPQGYCAYANLDVAGWRAHDRWVWMPPGPFPMGGPDEEGGPGGEHPVHTVTFASGFFVLETEISTLAYEACEAADACPAPAVGTWDNGWGVNRSTNGRADHPQNGLTWQDAQDFCAWITPDGGGRLPTEAEWEYAATGATHHVYPWGDTPAPTCANDTANFKEVSDGCGTSGTFVMGAKSAGQSVTGLFDLSGNVWEWVQDCWHADYTNAPEDGSAWTASCTNTKAVIRGGALNSNASSMRAAYRTSLQKHYHYASVGGRCVWPAP